MATSFTASTEKDEGRSMTLNEIVAVIDRADSLCSLIYYRERDALSAQTQEDLKVLCSDLRTTGDTLRGKKR